MKTGLIEGLDLSATPRGNGRLGALFEIILKKCCSGGIYGVFVSSLIASC